MNKTTDRFKKLKFTSLTVQETQEIEKIGNKYWDILNDSDPYLASIAIVPIICILYGNLGCNKKDFLDLMELNWHLLVDKEDGF